MEKECKLSYQIFSCWNYILEILFQMKFIIKINSSFFNFFSVTIRKF